MYAVVESGSKQYRVEPKVIFDVEKIEGPAKGKQVTLDRVLMVCRDKDIKIGTPTVSGAKVVCDYLGDVRSKKVVSFFYRRRKDSKSKKGHRQTLSRLLVKDIIAA
ncbi:MAG: 50S ribosomal protein L21 [Omnitrophica bacterium GWA2_52_8]|nr:MAG: 50S ribosomal protein L21 [Omnitrophica bacterium GWA2_52_8]